MRCVLGIDAGGSHTRCCIADENGRLLAFGRGGPANRNFVTPKSAQNAVERALSRALKSISREINAAVISGAHLSPDALAVVSRAAPTKRELFVDEFEASLAAGLRKPGGWGVVIMSGTGSFCKGRNAFGVARLRSGTRRTSRQVAE